MEFTHFVAAVIVFGVAQIGVASLSLAAWRAKRVGLTRSRPPVKPAHKVVVGGGEVSTASEIQADPVGGEIDFGLGDEEVVGIRSGTRARSGVVVREQGWRGRVGMVDGIRGVRSGGGGAWVVEGVVMKVVVVVVVDGGKMMMIREGREERRRNGDVTVVMSVIRDGVVENGEG